MKKILKLLLTLLFIPTLAGCSLFGGNKEENNRIVISDASFEYTYSTIKFNFTKDKNAIFYSAYFSGGSKNSVLNRVEPYATYDMPSAIEENTTYSVFLKATANTDYQDSDLFLLGEMTLSKEKRTTEDLYVSARLIDNYAIEVTAKNLKENDTSPLMVNIYKDNELFYKKSNIVGSSTFSTKENLYAGQYRVSVCFAESGETLQSDELFYDQPLTVGKRELYFSGFNASYSLGVLGLSWFQDSINVKRELTISFNGQSQTFTNSYKGKNIQSGMSIDANDFGSGEISFSLKLTPLEHTETFITPPVLTANTIISEYKLSTPDIEVFTNDKTGDFIIKNHNFVSGRYELSIHKANSSQYGLLEDLVVENEIVTSFPIIFEKACLNYNAGDYQVSVKRLGSRGLELDSDTAEVIGLLDYARYNPEFDFTNVELPNNNGYEAKIICLTPWWINESWTNNSFLYQIDLIGCGNSIATYYGTQNGQEVTILLPSTMMNGHYMIEISHFVSDDAAIPEEFSYTACIKVCDYEFDDNPYTDFENIITDLEVQEVSRDGSHSAFKISVDKKYAYEIINVTIIISSSTESVSTFKEINTPPAVTGKINSKVLASTPGGFIRSISVYVESWLGDYYTQLEEHFFYRLPIS